MALTKPDRYPRWATVGGAITEPNSARKDVGFEADLQLSAGEIDWLHNLAYQWIVYGDQRSMRQEYVGAASWMQSTITHSVGASRTANAFTGGTVWVAGVRIELDAGYLTQAGYATRTFTASRDTYINVNDDRVLEFQEVLNGAGAPTPSAGYTAILRVVTDATNVTSSTRLLAAIPTRDVTERVEGDIIVGDATSAAGTPSMWIDTNGGRLAKLAWADYGSAPTERCAFELSADANVFRFRFPGAATANTHRWQFESEAGATTDQQTMVAHRQRVQASNPFAMLTAASDAVEAKTVSMGGGVSRTGVDPADIVRLIAGGAGVGTTLLEALGSSVLTRVLGNFEVRANAADVRFAEFNLHRGTTTQNNSRVMVWSRQGDQTLVTDSLLVGTRDQLLADGEGMLILGLLYGQRIGAVATVGAHSFVQLDSINVHRNGTNLVANGGAGISLQNIGSTHPDAGLGGGLQTATTNIVFQPTGLTSVHRLFAFLIGLKQPIA